MYADVLYMESSDAVTINLSFRPVDPTNGVRPLESWACWDLSDSVVCAYYVRDLESPGTAKEWLAAVVLDIGTRLSDMASEGDRTTMKDRRSFPRAGRLLTAMRTHWYVVIPLISSRWSISPYWR
jgi:hypothetical protein